MNSYKKGLYTSLVCLSTIFGYSMQSFAAAPNSVVLPYPTSSSIMNRLQQVGRGTTVSPTFQVGNPISTRNNSGGKLFKNFFYIPASNTPCGGQGGALAADAGVVVFDVHDPKNPLRVATILPPTGSGSEDITFYTTQNGDNIAAIAQYGFCGGNIASIGTNGPDKVELYNINKPTNPVKLGEFAIRDISNFYALDSTGFLANNGLPPLNNDGTVSINSVQAFSQNGHPYIALSSNYPYSASDGVVLGSLQIYDVSKPSNPTLAGWWGPENIPNSQKDTDNKYLNTMFSHLAPADRPASMPALPVSAIPGVDDSSFNLFTFTNPTRQDFGILSNAYGKSPVEVRQANSISFDKLGKTAYVGIDEAGVAILDISNIANPKMIGLARDATSNDALRSLEVRAGGPKVTDNGKVMLHSAGGIPFTTDVAITGNPTPVNAVEADFSIPIATLPGQTFNGTVRFIGLACLNDPACGTNTFCSAPIPAPNGATIALIRRGSCAFTEKAQNALNAGYSAVIVMQRQGLGAAEGQAGSPVPIPDVMVSYDDGLAMLPQPQYSNGYVLTQADIGTLGSNVSINSVPHKYGDLRIWDISNPATPILASTVSTTCGDNPISPTCGNGSPSVGGEITLVGNLAYVSFANQGLEVLDITNPYLPVEVARWFKTGEPFETNNGVAPFGNGGALASGDVRVDTATNCIYLEDSRGGLYVLSDTKGNPCQGQNSQGQNNNNQ